MDEYDEMSVKDLRAEAARLEIPGRSKLTKKADLLREIKKYAQKEDTGGPSKKGKSPKKTKRKSKTKKDEGKQYLGKYKIISKLGEGVQGAVYLVELEGKEYAIKKYNIKNQEKLSSLAEIDLEMRINHPHIIRGIEVFRGKKHLYFVQEVADTDLSNYLINNELNIKTKTRLIYEIGTALQYIQSIDVLHCDIKPTNILVLKDRILVADMGISKYINDYDFEYICQTATHRSPEFLMKDRKFKKYASKKYLDLYHKGYNGAKNPIQGELWSYGMTSLDILYGTDSIVLKKSKNIGYFIDFVTNLGSISSVEEARKLIFSYLGDLPRDHHPILNLLLQKCLTGNLEQRSKTFTEIISSEVFSNNGFKMNFNVGNMRNIEEEEQEIDSKKKKFFLILNNWIIDLLKGFRLSNRLSFLTLALVRGLWHKHSDVIEEIQLFGASCVYLSGLVLGDYIELDDLSYMTADAYNEKQIFDFSMKIFIEENGAISRTTLYDYLSSLEMLQKASKMLLNDKKRAILKTKEIAEIIISEETAEEAEKRKPKDLRSF
jgi:serine/threonine protein kinase